MGTHAKTLGIGAAVTKIAAAAYEFNNQYKTGAYIAAGLVLFVLTFVVDSLARGAVAKTARGSR